MIYMDVTTGFSSIPYKIMQIMQILFCNQYNN